VEVFEVRRDIGVCMYLRIAIWGLEEFVEVAIRQDMPEVPSIASSSVMNTSRRHHRALGTCPDTQNDTDCRF